MKNRAGTKRKKDSKIYTHTAKKTKQINLAPRVSRGGIRL